VKILHISISDKIGGAAIAAYRLNEAMRKNDIESAMLVLNKVDLNNPYINTTGSTKKKILTTCFSKLEHFYLKYKYHPFATYSLSLLSFRISSCKELQEADIIYLHWINAGMLSIKEIKRILSLNKPVYWFLHDMWAFTGGCHYSFECDLYKTHCGKCSLLKSKIYKDTSYFVFNRKIKSFLKYSNLYIITPSTWLGKCAKQSFLFKNKQISVIPNVLDIETFKPINKKAARKILNFPVNKKLILFGADSGSSNPYKGWEYLKEALILIPDEDIEIVVFGNYLSPQVEKEIAFPVHSIGKLFDTYSLMLVYNAVDVFVTPSLADNFPNTILESLSCGTPVVGFDIGGIPDLIKHKETGYLAKYRDSNDLSVGIQWILHSEDYNLLCENARLEIERNYTDTNIIKRHQDLWEFPNKI
jgi:glycosyltransferase involved in cell wall biosynthesis